MPNWGPTDTARYWYEETLKAKGELSLVKEELELANLVVEAARYVCYQPSASTFSHEALATRLMQLAEFKKEHNRGPTNS
jgi:hypothetical protein